MKDETADKAIRNADVEISARRVAATILKFVKKHKFNMDSDIVLKSDITGKRYIRHIVKQTDDEPPKPKTLLEFLKQQNK